MKQACVHNQLIPTENLRNDQTPIDTLPPEILIELFLILRSDLSYNQSQAFEWSHVCSLWRSVAISISSLWSQVNLRNQPLSTLALGRCLTSPVSISLRVAIEEEPFIYKPQEALSKARLNRIEPLCLDVERGSLIHILDNGLDSLPNRLPLFAEEQKPLIYGALESCFDRIESVCLDVKRDSLMHILNGGLDPLPPSLNFLSLRVPLYEEGVEVLKEYLNADLPLLTVLHLDMVIIRFLPALYENLTDLKLYNMSGHSEASMDSLLDTLGSCHKLVRLDLLLSVTDVPEETEDPQIASRPIVELPLLEYVFIRDDYYRVACFLAHLHIPCSAKLELKLHTYESDFELETLFSCIFPFDRTNFHHLMDINCLKYDIDNNTDAIFTAGNLQVHLVIDSTKVSDVDDDSVDTFFVPFMDEFSLGAVENFHVVCTPYPGFLEAHWERVIPRLQSLRTIEYQVYPESSYYHYGPGLYKNNVDLFHYLGNPHFIVCPTLETLILLSVRFTPDVEGDLVEAILECLRIREAHGFRLKQLFIRDFQGLEQEKAALLEQFVDHFHISFS